MKLAAIDIGTNSVRLLISNYNNSRFTTLERKMEITRVGKNLETSGKISPEAARNTLTVLSSYLALMENREVVKYRAVGTSAVRNAKNKSWFTGYISKNIGIEIEPIQGTEEAYLSFYGAVKGLGSNNFKSNIRPGTKDKILVIDTGGGSSELILGEQSGRPELIYSIKMGCVNLTERFIGPGRPGKNELASLHEYIRKKLNAAVNRIRDDRSLFLIGTGGTITTLAAIDLKLEEYDSKRIHGYLLSLDTIEEIYKYLCSLSPGERKKVPGLQPGRADIIISGIAISLEILRLLEREAILVSERDILDGIVYTLVDF